MKHLLYVAFLSIALPALLAGTVETEASTNLGSGPPAHSGNDNKRRGRGRGRDDANGHDGNRSSNNSNSNSSRSDRSASAISVGNARAIAIKAVPGTIVKEEFEQKRGRWVYEFYIRENGGETFEVYVDAHTGDIVKTEQKSRR